MRFKSFNFLCYLVVLMKVSESRSQRSRSDYAGKVLKISPKACSSPSYPGVKGTCMISLECSQRKGTVIGACRDGVLFGACCTDAASTDLPHLPTTTTARPPHSSENQQAIKIPQSLLSLAILSVAEPEQAELAFEEEESHLASSISSIMSTTTTQTTAQTPTQSPSTATPSTISPSTEGTTTQESQSAPISSESPLPVSTAEDDAPTTTPTPTTSKFIYGKIKFSPRPLQVRATTERRIWTRPPLPTTESFNENVNPEEGSSEEEERVERTTPTTTIPTTPTSTEPSTSTPTKWNWKLQTTPPTAGAVNSTNVTVTRSNGDPRGNPPTKQSRLSNEIDSEDEGEGGGASEGWDNKLNDFVNQVVEGIAVELDKSNIDDVLFKTTTSTTTTTTPTPKRTKNSKKKNGKRTTTTTTTTTPPRRKKGTKTKTEKPKKKKGTKKPRPPESYEVEGDQDVPDYREMCGVRPLASKGRHARIVGGNPSEHGNWPWHALLKETVWWGIFSKVKCGGVLIGPRHVLTAAHCKAQPTGSLSVVLGVTDSDNPSTHAVTKAVRRIVRHPHFNPRTFENDIAILELESPVPFQPHIVPICLPHEKGQEGGEGEEDFVGKKGFVTGMGLLKHDGERPSMLYEVDVPILNNTECQKMFRKSGNMKPIKPSFICAGYQNGRKDSCGGDSGGPLSVRRTNGQWVLAGTVSHGIKCAVPNQPGVYMRTTFYKPWIQKVINSSISGRGKCVGPPPVCEPPLLLPQRKARSGGFVETIFRIFRNFLRLRK